MSTEAQVAMLMLRILIDRPKELQKVLDYLQSQVVLKKAVLEVGKMESATREEILREFEEKYGLVVDFFEEESGTDQKTLLSAGMTDHMIGLPGGAKFRVG